MNLGPPINRQPEPDVDNAWVPVPGNPDLERNTLTGALRTNLPDPLLGDRRPSDPHAQVDIPC